MIIFFDEFEMLPMQKNTAAQKPIDAAIILSAVAVVIVFSR